MHMKKTITFSLSDANISSRRAIDRVAGVSDFLKDTLNSAARTEDIDMDAIAKVLTGSTEPMRIKKLAEQLEWDSKRTARALHHGGASGKLSFSKIDSDTAVLLKK